jgi:hypothetical protein
VSRPRYQHRPIRETRPAVKRPFWLPASNYYVLSVALSTAFFFLMWGILHDAGDEAPWITAGIAASILVAGAVILREVILRRARMRHYRMQQQINANFASVGRVMGERPQPRKLTLEQNAAVLHEISQKSNAAKILNKFSAGHREVVELCTEYIARNEEELKTVAAGSPRLRALLKGRTAALEFHRFHMLMWAEIEATQYMSDANTRADVGERLKAANDAAAVIDHALAAYPSDGSLIASREVIRETVTSIKGADTVERAERAAYQQDYRQAIGLYRDALFYLGRDNLDSEERRRAADRLRDEIEKLRLLDPDA